MAGRSSVRSILLVYLFLLSSGDNPAEADDKPTKEYSRIRQLSGDQYGSQYGVAQDDRRPQARSTLGRPLFAWNEIGPLVPPSDKSTALSNGTTESERTLKQSPGTQRRNNKLHSRQQQQQQQRLRSNQKKAIASSYKSSSALKKSFDYVDDEEHREGDEEDGEEGDEEGDEEEDEEEEGEEGDEEGGEEDDESGDEEGGEESDDNEEEGANKQVTTTSATTTTTSTATTVTTTNADATTSITSATTPLINGTAAGGKDSIDRSGSQHPADKSREEESTISAPVAVEMDRPEKAEAAAAHPDESGKEDEDAEEADDDAEEVTERSHQIEKDRPAAKNDVNVEDDIRSNPSVRHSANSAEDRSETDGSQLPPVADSSPDRLTESSSSGGSNNQGGQAARSNIADEKFPLHRAPESAVSSDDDHDEANEIRAQVQGENQSSSSSSGGATASSSSTEEDDDDETNDIQVRPTGNRAKSPGAEDAAVVRSEEVEDDDDDDADVDVDVAKERKVGSDSDTTNDLDVHSSRSNLNKSPNEPADLHGFSGDDDETNDIRPALSSADARSGAGPESDNAVANEIETILPSEPFVHKRLLHGQTDGLDPALLDVSCGAFTPLPAIPNAVVAKYGRTRWPSPPFNLVAEVIFECQDDGNGQAYQLDPALPDRLFCSNQQWIGQHPKCVTIHRQQQPHFAPTGPDDDDDNVVDKEEEDDEEESLNSLLPSPPTRSAINSTSAGANEQSCSSDDRGGCEHVCTQSAEPDAIRCLCYRGFRLDSDGKSCADVDECATDNGGCDGQCTNRPGSFLCSCPVGFRLASNGKKCIDVNECSLRNGHGPCQGACHNTHGSYHCSCDDMAGTQLAADGHSCEDIDECKTDNGGCSHSCLNTLGTAFCACPEGYMLADDWKTCEDIDECDYDPDDDQERLCPGICRNTIGSYICVDPDEEPITCPEGYEPNEDDGQCHDVDECATTNGGCSHFCSNTEGSHRCDCPAGLFLEADNRTCQDIDECASDNGGCTHSCVNVPSSYQCSCPEGFALADDWKTCHDVDECADSATPTCGAVGTCLNLIGSYRCICPAGYEETNNGCIDIDECRMDPCGSGECFNEHGTYTCACQPGFQFDNQTCQDVNECDDGNPCFDGICENNVGSFTCSCKPGYYLENNTCFDVDECVNSPCIDGTCVNEPGSYLCLCEPGYTLERNVCIDFDECLISPCVNGTCVNQIGSFRCDCPEGYSSQNNSCFDVDECKANPCVNGECVNTEGSYWCRCLDGFKALGNICLDIDECESAPCVNGECINTHGSYQCECLPGFYLEGDSCFDVDECQANPCVNGTCVNLLGSYQCNCPAGHNLVDSRICLDNNECATNNGDCDQRCTNTPGSFFCSCDQGFFLDPEDKRQCLDVDECATNNGGCSQVCLNRPGNFSCECRTGYVLSADKSSCLEVVSAVTHYCPAIEPPPGGYLHCSSRPGANGYKPGTTCTLRCRKGYAFRRHKPQLTWQANQILENPLSVSEKTTTVLLPSRQSSSGLAMLQGWKATQVRPVDQGWQSGNRPYSEDTPKKSKEKTVKKNENEKRQLATFGGRAQSIHQGLRRNRPRNQGERVKRQQQQQGRRELPDQPFRRCGDEGKWRGKLGFCQALTCPPLTKPANGSVSPLSCATGDAAPNQRCYFSCNTGFRVTGNPVRTCLPSLKWNPPRPPPSCEKVHPWPRIECPKDMTVDLSPGKRTIEVFIPQPATNVDYLSNVEAEPSWAKKLRAELGPVRLVISFRARNPVTEYTAICSFVLEVRDREAPTIKDCPHDVHVRLSSLEPYVNAPWVEPTFTDNIAVTHVIKSKEPNSLFPLGEHVVSYTASDAAGNNARCQFTVNVSPALVPALFNRNETCARLESPPNGDLNCLSWTWGQMCRPSCSTGHVFFRPLPSAVYLCGRDRRWKPGTSVPDCAPTSIIPEGGCPVGWEERRSGGKQCVGCAPGLHRPSNSTVCIPCPMGTYQDNFSEGSCKSCPKKLTTCSMGARQCTDCKAPEECSASAQRNLGADSEPSSSSTSSKLPIQGRRRQLQRMRLRQQHRLRQNSSATATNLRRL